MGRFFTSISVLCDRPVEGFLTEAMREKGYFPHDEGIRLHLVPDNGRWQTIHFHVDDGEISSPLIDALLTHCKAVLTLFCFDSDCLLIELETKEKEESVWVGEPYDPTHQLKFSLTPEFWQQAVSDTAAFKKILDGEYTFVEDSLTDLAPLFGFDAEKMNVTSDELEANPPKTLKTFRFGSDALEADKMFWAWVEKAGAELQGK